MDSIEKAIKLKEELDSLRPIDKEREAIIMQKFRLDWNYHSNHLEGNSLTYGETKALILFGITAQGKPLKDHFEMTGHNEALEWVTDIVKGDYPLTESFIRKLHILLLKEPYYVKAKTPDGKPTRKRIEIGKYKEEPNHVETITGEIFRFATPEETPALMGDLIKWYNEKRNNKETNGILLASEFHYRFLRIHPFDDGNGRTARILMNFILMQYGYPPVIIKTEDKENYFSALRQADAGMFEPFAEYIAKNLVRSLEIMIAGAKGESIEEPDDLDKEIALLEQKIHGAGKRIEVTKSKEAILEIYDNSVSRGVAEFIKASKKFDKFYVKTEFSFVVHKIVSSHDKLNAIVQCRDKISENIEGITIMYKFISFNHEGFGEFDHTSQIIFTFGFSGYNANNRYSSDENIQKKYDEQLTEEEISIIVKREIKLHKDYIEKQLKAIQDKKKS
jgi:Fic family protein